MKRFTFILSFMVAIVVLSGCSEVGEVIEKSNKYLDMRIDQIEAGEGQDCCCGCDDAEGDADTAGDSDGVNDEANTNTNGSGNRVSGDLDEDGGTEDGTDGEVATNKEEVPEFEEKEYESDQGDVVNLSFGDLAFATGVVDFSIGDPAPIDEYANPKDALGEPNYNPSDNTGFVSLGGSGSIVVEFEYLYLVDGPGDDLYIFEIGPAVEPMFVEISEDGSNWIEIGEVSGGESSVDIAPFVGEDDLFKYVKLTDMRRDTFGESPGADITAVAIINGQLK